MRKIRVLLAEDHTLVRKGLRALLDDAEDIAVIAEAANGRDAIAEVEENHPDVIVMDLSMPLMSGLEATHQICERDPGAKIIILTVHANEEYILQALRAGASGYLLKEAAPTDLIRAIKVVHQGEAFLSPTISRNLIRDYVEKTELLMVETRFDRLTSREREVLQLTAEGYAIKDIATHLSISDKTVRTHRKNLMNKLDIHNTAELTLFALRHGLITLE